jgi:hypothetical protein
MHGRQKSGHDKENGEVQMSSDLDAEVQVANGCLATTVIHKPVVVVDTRHVNHHTEVGISLNKVRIFQERNRLLNESPSLIRSALRATVEVLAGPFSDPDGLAKGVVPVVDISDEGVRADVVPMNGNEIKLAVRADFDKPLHPGHAVGVGRGGGGSNTDSSSLERRDRLAPKLGGRLRRHVGLARFLGLVEAKNGAMEVGITGNSVEGALLAPTPQHGDELQAETVILFFGCPVVIPRGLGPFVEVALHAGPGETFLTRGIGGGGSGVGRGRIGAATAVGASAIVVVSAVAVGRRSVSIGRGDGSVWHGCLGRRAGPAALLNSRAFSLGNAMGYLDVAGSVGHKPG